MKIDDNCINHNALRLIENIGDDPYYLCQCDDTKTVEQNFRIALMTIGEINGVLMMANAMKEVLKA